MRTKSETSQTEPPTHTAQQLEQRRRLCEIVSAPGTPEPTATITAVPPTPAATATVQPTPKAVATSMPTQDPEEVTVRNVYLPVVMR